MFIRFWHLVTVISGSFCVYDLVHSWVFSRVSFFSCSTCAKWLILLRPCLWPSLLKACSLVFSRIFSFLYPIGSFCWRATSLDRTSFNPADSFFVWFVFSGSHQRGLRTNSLHFPKQQLNSWVSFTVFYIPLLPIV